MDIEQIRTLNILNEISQNSTTSQRAMSERLNISLGLVNSFVKRLANKGYFKITTIPRNRVRYIMTPKGAAEKTRLTYEYLKYSYAFFKDARNRILLIFQKMVEQGSRKIVFYGAGELAEISHTLLLHTPLELVAVIDTNRCNKKFMGKIILHPKSLENLLFDKILITELNTEKRDSQIVDELKTHQKNIVYIY